MPENKWRKTEASQLNNSLDELVYRSNLLASDRRIVNWGGGNTSMKTIETDFRGREIEVIWVKGSGSDLATAKNENFTGLRMDDIRPLIERDKMSDGEMVSYLSHCMIDSSHPRSSIETLLHAFLPFSHVDHTHPDAIISICCADNGKQVAKEIFRDRFVWVPYIRPGFSLSKKIAEAVQSHPKAELVLMEKHGLVTWGNTSEECYQRTISVIQEAEDYIEKKMDPGALFGGRKHEPLPVEERKEILTKILPEIRGAISPESKVIVTYDDSEDVLYFVNSRDAQQLSQIGAACPDHLVHTKRNPLFVEWDPQTGDAEHLVNQLKLGRTTYEEEYRKYFNENNNEGDRIREVSPRVILIPGIGMINIGKSWSAAAISEALYHRAIAVMRGATALGRFVSLNQKESYDVEYWPLELYKLSLTPPEAEFSRKISFVTGGAGGIGSETCRRFAIEGAHVVVADLDLEDAKKVSEEINSLYGDHRAIAVKLDVTKEDEVSEAFRKAILTYGGVDIVVNNAGLSTSNSIDHTTIDEWNLNMNVLGTGYFLVSREASRIMKAQGIGGSLVFVGSKNAIYAGKNNVAYSTAKAAEVHLARCLATELGPYGIRVNSVLPDAVLQGSKIWSSEWREQRAKTYGIKPEELDEHYRKRTILSVNVFPKDVAEAIAFYASTKSEKTTGNMMTVDGGVPAAYTR